MPITYGPNYNRTVLLKAYTTHAERSDVFLSYQRSDQNTAVELAKDLSRRWDVFIDVYDGTLDPSDMHVDNELMTAITNADTMVVVVSDNTQQSWWVPWEIGVSTPYRKPRALYKPQATKQLPAYLQKLRRLEDSISANQWVAENRGRR